MESSTHNVSDSNLTGDWGLVGARKNIRQEPPSHLTEDTTCPAIDLQIERNSEQQVEPKGAVTWEDLSQHLCSKQTSMRNVDAHYVVYMGEYETGDTVVWSALECIRAFQQSEECILPYLAKGKACPCHGFIGPKIKKDVACGGSGGMS
jgi:hypothetical protein